MCVVAVAAVTKLRLHPIRPLAFRPSFALFQFRPSPPRIQTILETAECIWLFCLASEEENQDSSSGQKRLSVSSTQGGWTVSTWTRCCCFCSVAVQEVVELKRHRWVISFSTISVSSPLNGVFNKVHSADAVCRAQTDVNKLFHFNHFSGWNYNRTFAVSSLFALAVSPYQYSISSPIRDKRLPFCTHSCFMIIFPPINPPPNTHSVSPLSSARIRFWFRFGQGMFALSSFCLEANTEEEQDGRFLFERCEWEDSKEETGYRSQKTKIAKIYFIDRTSWWDLQCSDFLCLTGKFMALLCPPAPTLTQIKPVPHLQYQICAYKSWWVGFLGRTVRFIHVPMLLEEQYLQPSGTLRNETLLFIVGVTRGFFISTIIQTIFLTGYLNTE